MTIDDVLSRLSAGLARDEAIARAAALRSMPGTERWQFADMQVRSEDEQRTLVVKHTWPHEGEHIALHDPARVLNRYIPAIRKVIDEHADDGHGKCITCSKFYAYPCPTLRALAGIYELTEEG